MQDGIFGTIDQYLRNNIDNFKYLFENFKVIESTTANVDIAGLTGYKFVFTYQHNGTDYQRMETGTILGNKVFYITYDAERENYSNYLPSVN
jgi:hypothetical protein